MTPPRRGDEGARGRSRTSDVRLSGTGAPAVERRALVLLNVEQTGREASRCLRRESNPRLRFRRAASCPSDREGSAFRRRRTTNTHRRRREGKGSTRNAPRTGCIPAQEKGRPGGVRDGLSYDAVVRRQDRRSRRRGTRTRRDTPRAARRAAARGAARDVAGPAGRVRARHCSSRSCRGGPRTGMSSTEEDRTRLRASAQPHFQNSSEFPGNQAGRAPRNVARLSSTRRAAISGEAPPRPRSSHDATTPCPCSPAQVPPAGRLSTAWHTFLHGARRRRPGRPVGAVGALGAVGGDR